MKKTMFVLVFLSVLILNIGCSKIETFELCKITDEFVESFENSYYKSYGIFNNNYKETSKGLYRVKPIGRLINVKIMKVVDDREYVNLKKRLEKRYRNNNTVNKVYICNAGTLMIDCRR